MAGKPLWRAGYDRVERAAAPPLERLVASPAFAEAVTAAMRLNSHIRRWAERRTRRLWHLANLPAGSDVARLHEQVASLDRQVRRLTASLEDTRGELPRATASDPEVDAGHDRPGPTGGRAQRAARA